jgi:hypothetical protein
MNINSPESHFTFNYLKHHLLYVRSKIFELNFDITRFENEINLRSIKIISNNVMDLYTGSLSIENIYYEVFSLLSVKIVVEEYSYVKLLGKQGYWSIVLSDDSIWVLRYGMPSDAFIHIHPGRGGDHTLRLTGSAWKTALFMAFYEVDILHKNTVLEKVNFARTTYLQLSPIKELIPGSNLHIALSLLDIL